MLAGQNTELNFLSRGHRAICIHDKGRRGRVQGVAGVGVLHGRGIHLDFEIGTALVRHSSRIIRQLQLGLEVVLHIAGLAVILDLTPVCSVFHDGKLGAGLQAGKDIVHRVPFFVLPDRLGIEGRAYRRGHVDSRKAGSKIGQLLAGLGMIVDQVCGILTWEVGLDKGKQQQENQHTQQENGNLVLEEDA